MPLKIVWTHSADLDLSQVYEYLYPRSQRSWRRWIAKLFRAVDRLAEFPHLGPIADLDLDREYRQVMVEHFKIFYFIDKDQVVIARVWDTRQDPSRLLFPED